jgi:hypothetical protein
MPRTFLNKNNIPRGDGLVPKIKFELFGDWTRAMSVLKTMGPKVKESSLRAQLKVGNVIAKKVKAHIRNQDLGWQGLDEDYAKAKGAGGLSGKVLMGYKTYYNEIKVWKSGNRHLVNIGVRRGIYTRELSGGRSKLEVAAIAGVHEFSSGRRIPRRPLWNPTIAEIGGVKGIQKMYINSLIWHLRMFGVPVTAKRTNNTSISIDGSKLKF